MAILIREYLNSPLGLNENSCAPFSLKESVDTLSTISKDSLMVDIEGIHVGPTRNFTWYTEEALKRSIPTWTKPYERPLILHHNEKDGKIVGRVLSAYYTDVNTRSKTGALVFGCNVSDEEGKKGVKDGRFKTVSIGVIAHDVRCSICGHVISEYGECEHERGAIYDGKTCYWMIYDMEAKELSYVIVPSDIYAHNIKIYSPKEKSLTENLEEGVLKVSKATEIKESTETVIVEDADKKEQTKVAEPKAAEHKEETTSQEPEIKEDTVETLRETISKLEGIVEDLKTKVSKAEAKAKEAEELKDVAEEELIAVNNQLKEFAVEQVLMLREQLGRPALLKESLTKRSKDSLIDTISDLKEEMAITTSRSVAITENVNSEEVEEVVEKAEDVEIKESVEEVNSVENLANIEKPLTESLIDENKDSSVKKEDEVEKNSGLDVKESAEISNIDYEATLERMSKYYNL